ncbi:MULTISPECIES: hypothetical protein [Streptomyces]|uniref:hypothetical protein n=1 Tax=Streptomyces TaxID=1883 RepID=UPI00167AE492|nr:MULTISPECIES: hypothetical protein [Streptomyces]WGP12338.1 hypothetical protein QFA72_23045 [Streptomyces sp. SH5]GGP35646.1 hypothetical protein GCM10010231_03240 [Streptomyces sindenensis]
MKQSRSGVTENISVSMPSELVSELRSRTGRRGLSSYVTEAVRHQLAMDGLAEIVASHEEEHGALTEQEIEAARRELFGDASAEGVERGAA